MIPSSTEIKKRFTIDVIRNGHTTQITVWANDKAQAFQRANAKAAKMFEHCDSRGLHNRLVIP